MFFAKCVFIGGRRQMRFIIRKTTPNSLEGGIRVSIPREKFDLPLSSSSNHITKVAIAQCNRFLVLLADNLRSVGSQCMSACRFEVKQVVSIKLGFDQSFDCHGRQDLVGL